MTLSIEFEQEADGRWFAEVPSLPGVMTYGNTRTDVGARVQAMTLRVLAERLEHGEAVPELLNVTFHAA
jgi:predicted RNase H-like HicB family nuclease